MVHLVVRLVEALVVVAEAVVVEIKYYAEGYSFVILNIN